MNKRQLRSIKQLLELPFETDPIKGDVFYSPAYRKYYYVKEVKTIQELFEMPWWKRSLIRKWNILMKFIGYYSFAPVWKMPLIQSINKKEFDKNSE